MEADKPNNTSRDSSCGTRGGRWCVALVLLAAVVALSLWWANRTQRPKIALIGIDGAEWSVIWSMIERGELPNFDRLVREGTTAQCESYGQTMSPQVWNTIVTGKHYLEHGIDWFVVKAGDVTEKGDLEEDEDLIPVTSRHRRVPALWDILSQAGHTVGAIGFWATWPATPVNGFMVSDRFSYSRVNKLASAHDNLLHQTYPAELAEELRDLIVTPDSVSPAQRRDFMSESVQADDWRKNHDIVSEFDITYAQTETYHRVAQRLLDRGQPDFFACYFQGVDVISHYFWEFMQPETAGRTVPPERLDSFGDTIEAMYRRQDTILGELLERFDDDTIVIVVSDHGFRPVPFDKRSIPTVSGWHRLHGVLAIWGPGVKSGMTLTDASVFDITPTVLALMGEPVAKDMQGRVLEEAFEEGVLGAIDLVAVYDRMPEQAPINEADIQSPMDQAMLERLRGIGYIGGGEDGAGLIEQPGTPDD
ncbi:MAG: sulfatase-like hydrolase/transferase [bacterium]|nr:sulfatase-like hydrolase/transferase [bacterium]